MKTRGQRSKRRNRFAKTKRYRQRGGKKVALKSTQLWGKNGQNIYLDFNDNPTPRQLLQAYFEQGKGQLQPFSKYETLESPPFTLLTEQGKHIKVDNWNTPYNFPDTVKFIYHREKNLARQQASETAAGLPILLSLLDCLYQGFGFSKLSQNSYAMSSNLVSEIKKNVKQQFKFHKAPQNPIVLYDRAFFGPSSAQDDNFYNILKFEKLTQNQVESLFRRLKELLRRKVVSVQNESSSVLSGKASMNQEQVRYRSRLERNCSPPPPGALIQYFLKPGGIPFSITEGGNEAFKRAYLQEVQHQAADSQFDEMQPLLIVVVKYFSSEEGVEQLREKAAETNCAIYAWEV